MCVSRDLPITRAATGPAAFAAFTIARCLSTVTFGNLLRKRFITYKTWELGSPLVARSRVMGRERAET